MFEQEGVAPPVETVESELFELTRSLVLSGEYIIPVAKVHFGGVGTLQPPFGANQSTIHLDGIMLRPNLWIGDTQVIDAGRFLVGDGPTAGRAAAVLSHRSRQRQ